MNFLFGSTAFVFLLFFANIAEASCTGVKGCNPCYDTLLGATKADVSCKTDDECIAIPNRCKDFYFVNRAHSKKFIDKKIKPDPSKKAPSVVCKFHVGWQAKVCQSKK